MDRIRGTELRFEDHVLVEDVKRRDEAVRRAVGPKFVTPFAKLASTGAHGNVFRHQIGVVAGDQFLDDGVEKFEIPPGADGVGGSDACADVADGFPGRFDDKEKVQERGVVGLPILSGLIVRHDHGDDKAHDFLEVNAGDDAVLDAGWVTVNQFVEDVEVGDILVVPIGVARCVIPLIDEAELGENEASRS